MAMTPTGADDVPEVLGAAVVVVPSVTPLPSPLPQAASIRRRGSATAAARFE